MKTAILLSLLTAILLAIGLFLGGIAGMTFALVFALAINFISYWFSDKIVLRIYRAKPAKDKKLLDIVEKLAREAGIPKPRAYVIPNDNPNAFATGRDPSHAAVAVTNGLAAFSHDELEGVLAHEISHIKNRDTLVQTVAATIAGAIAYLAQIGYYSMFSSRDDDRGNAIGIILIVIFAPLAAALIRLAISRRREYQADFGGATISKNPLALASALRKIASVSAQNPMRGNSATASMWIANPFKQDRFNSLFSTHPPIEKRIYKLERMGGKKGDADD